MPGQAGCALSGQYSDAGAEALSVQLGDLQVSGLPRSRGALTRGNATYFCELASVLRKEMLASAVVGFMTVVKGSIYYNPIPERKLRSQEEHGYGRMRRRHLQGHLDG